MEQHWLWIAVKAVALVCAVYWVAAKLIGLRRSDESATDSPNADADSVSGAVQTVATPPPSDEVVPDAYVLGDIENPLVRMVPLQEMSQLNGTRIELNKVSEKSLNSILSFAPNVALAGNVAANGGRCLQVVFSPEATQALKDGTATLMKVGDGFKAVVKGSSNGKFREIGQIVKGGVAKGPAVALLAWQMAAMITAQKYLADISAQLKKIEAGIAEIKNWLEDEQWGKIKGMYDYISDMGARIHRQGELSLEVVDRLLTGLENLELEILQMDAMLDRQVQRIVEEGKHCSNSGLKGRLQEIQEEHSRLQEPLRRRLICFRIRMGASILRLRLGESPVGESVKIERLMGDMFGLKKGFEEFFSATKGDLVTREPTTGELWNAIWGGPNDENIKALLGTLKKSEEALLPDVAQTLLEGVQVHEQIKLAESQRERPTSVVIEFDPETKRIREARYLEETS